MCKRADVKGVRFGHLVGKEVDQSNTKYWFFECDCGNVKRILRTSVVCGDTRSCGCLWHKKKYSEEEYNERQKNSRRRSVVNSKTEKRAFIFSYLKNHPCVDCGESDLVVLEFDHRDPALKIKAVSVLVIQSWSLHRVIEEVKKCDVRCANCHRRRHTNQRLLMADTELDECLKTITKANP